MATAKKITKKTAAKKISSTSGASGSTVNKKSTQPKATSISAALPATKMPSMQQLRLQIKRPQVFIPVLVILAAIFLYFAKGWFLVALVNGHPISRVTVDRNLESQYGKTEINSLITQELIQEEAAKKHVTVSDAELQASMKQISEAVAQQGQTLDQVLAARNMTMKDFQDQVRLQKMVEKLLADQIKVSDQEVTAYINNNKDTLPQGMTDAQLRAEVKQQLQQQKLSDKAQAWITNLQKQAKIQYFVNF